MLNHHMEAEGYKPTKYPLLHSYMFSSPAFCIAQAEEWQAGHHKVLLLFLFPVKLLLKYQHKEKITLYQREMKCSGGSNFFPMLL